MEFSLWRQWLRRFKDSIAGKPHANTIRRTCLAVEALEDRITPSTVVYKPFHVVLPSHRISEPQLAGYVDPSTGGYTPLGIQTAYGIDSLLNAGDNGAGQTIAVVDAYDDPFFSSTGTAGFAQSDLASFDSIFGLPDPPSFLKVGQLGYSNNFSTTSFPGPDFFDQWEGEESLDVEWAHSIAPQAKIILVECTDATSLMQGVKWAATPVAQGGGGATVVSMSFGTAGGYPGETAEDSYFDPTVYPGVTFLASTDDTGSGQDYIPNDGSESTGQAAYPADSSDVIAVGGTSLTLDPNSGAYLGESVWNDGFDPYNDDFDATGGGISFFEPTPAYQYGLTIQNGESTVSAGGMRATPDVSFLADPYTGVDIYDTYDGNGFYDGAAGSREPVGHRRYELIFAMLGRPGRHRRPNPHDHRRIDSHRRHPGSAGPLPHLQLVSLFPGFQRHHRCRVTQRQWHLDGRHRV